MKNPDLADTFDAIAAESSDIIYKGEIARKISSLVREGGGLITPKDLENYQVIERKPLTAKYGNYKIYTNSPPSVGGLTLVQMLKALSNTEYKEAYDPEHGVNMGKIIYTGEQIFSLLTG